MAKLIDGKATAQQIRAEMKAEIKNRNITPVLVVFLVGDRKDSATYVRMKRKACEQIGMTSLLFGYPESVEEEKLVCKIQEINKNPLYHGILVQLPLPDHINTQNVLASIDPKKDADGLHMVNQGDLFVNGHNASVIPCTPKGCLELLDRYNIKIEGKNAVVLGRSRLVGKPIAQLLLSRNATVTTCHSRTKNLAQIVKKAEILVSCVGKPQFVKGDWIRKGAVVIDVGINPIDDPSKKRGYRLVGDVEFDEASKRASFITPVPGGVGPMTVAMLLRNTLNSVK
jgi:5,10-methylene-tetrahydrofolate dehydrogenase/methenyl tetrahydrofolate cyclohydrolase